MSHPSENRSLNAEVTRAKPLVIAHRGASGLAPENTIAAFRLAAGIGADGIELDVHLAADGVPVVIHDSRVNRTTSGHGAVSTFTVKQLSKLDAALWFESRLARRPLARSRTLAALGITDRGRRIFADEGVPTLDGALTVLSTLGLSRIYIELKGPPRKRALLEATLSVVGRHLLEDIVTLLSFDHEIMRDSKALAPSVRTAATFPAPGRRLISTASIIRAAQAASVDEVALHAGLATRR